MTNRKIWGIFYALNRQLISMCELKKNLYLKCDSLQICLFSLHSLQIYVVMHLWTVSVHKVCQQEPIQSISSESKSTFKNYNG